MLHGIGELTPNRTIQNLCTPIPKFVHQTSCMVRQKIWGPHIKHWFPPCLPPPMKKSHGIINSASHCKIKKISKQIIRFDLTGLSNSEKNSLTTKECRGLSIFFLRIEFIFGLFFSHIEYTSDKHHEPYTI